MAVEGEVIDGVFSAVINGSEQVLKITGQGAKELALLIFSIMRDARNKGSVGLSNFLAQGYEMDVITLPAGKDELKKFDSEMKKHGLLYHAVKMKRGEKEGSSTVDILINSKDAPVIKRILEKIELATLDISHIQDVTNDLDAVKQAEDITRAIAEPDRSSFGKSLDRFTDGALKAKRPVVVVDAEDPAKRIELSAVTDVFNGKSYLKTTYEIYQGDDLVGTFDDGRFDGRSKDFWTNLKEKMQETGGFSDTMLRFFSEDHYEAWRGLEAERGKDQEMSTPEEQVEVETFTIDDQSAGKPTSMLDEIAAFAAEEKEHKEEQREERKTERDEADRDLGSQRQQTQSNGERRNTDERSGSAERASKDAPPRRQNNSSGQRKKRSRGSRGRNQK
jgi:hypothetical protein